MADIALNCADHKYIHRAEIEFALVGPDAIIVLEVKGGRGRAKGRCVGVLFRFCCGSINGPGRRAALGPIWRSLNQSASSLRN